MGTWQRYKKALAGEALPAALVDLDALDRNLATLTATVSAAGKTVRLASKSIRVPALLRYIIERSGGAVRGLMTYTARESALLVAEGHTDLLLAYPTLDRQDLDLLASLNRGGAIVRPAVDCEEHVAALESAASRARARIPVVIDVDMSYRAALGAVHLGVRRSPLHRTRDVVALAERVSASASLSFAGLLAYEAQIAGVTDQSPFARWKNPAKRAMKLLSRPQVERTRADLCAALRARGIFTPLFNGGGTGSALWCSREDALTEVTIGSGFLASHLFDYYRDQRLVPAAYFALQVTRLPADGIVTCHGGGFVASGAALCPR